MKYSYIIIKENYPELERESVLLSNKYNSKKKYAFIEKIVHKDGSESISNIYYSNKLDELTNKAKGFISWYNYPMNLCKNIQGYISELV